MQLPGQLHEIVEGQQIHKITSDLNMVVSKTTYFLLFKSIKNLDFTGSFK